MLAARTSTSEAQLKPRAPPTTGIQFKTLQISSAQQSHSRTRGKKINVRHTRSIRGMVRNALFTRDIPEGPDAVRRNRKLDQMRVRERSPEKVAGLDWWSVVRSRSSYLDRLSGKLSVSIFSSVTQIDR